MNQEFNYTREECLEIIDNTFSSIKINGIENFNFSIDSVNNPIIKRLAKRAIFSNILTNARITIDFFDNSPSDFTYLLLKCYNLKNLICYSNMEFTFDKCNKDIDYYINKAELLTYIYQNDEDLKREENQGNYKRDLKKITRNITRLKNEKEPKSKFI